MIWDPVWLFHYWMEIIFYRLKSSPIFCPQGMEYSHVGLNNYFSGPYPENAHPEILRALKGKRFDWGTLLIDKSFKNKQTEGLVYFCNGKIYDHLRSLDV